MLEVKPFHMSLEIARQQARSTLIMAQQRKVFRSAQDWHNFTNSLQNKEVNGNDLLALRKACYLDIEKKRGRPLIVYASRFMDTPRETPNSIDLTDVDGFTDLVHAIVEGDSVDVLLHSPGGNPDATERIVGILRRRFKTVHFLVPHSAYSAATMLALSGDTVTLHPSATLGPIDPQINGIPARSMQRGFEKIKKKIAEEGPESLPAYIPLIEKYSIELLELCEDSEKLAKKLVGEWIRDFMFQGKKGLSKRVSKAVTYFSSYDKHLLHSRPLSFGKISKFDLNIEEADQELSELLWEAYILINGFFSVSHFVKLFETAHGVSWGKQFAMLRNPSQEPELKKPKK